MIPTFTVFHDYRILDKVIVEALNEFDNVWVVVALQRGCLFLCQLVVIRIQVKFDHKLSLCQ